MRNALILGSLLVLITVGAANAAPANHGVTAGVGYYVADLFGERDFYRHFSVTAETGRPNLGNWTWNRPEGNYSGDVTCVTQAGSDVWIAGTVVHTGLNDFTGLFALIHDGGAGAQGDQAFVWGADPGQTLAQMEEACESMADPGDDLFENSSLFTVVQGNAAVH